MLTRGNQIITRALGRGNAEDWGRDLHKAHLAHLLTQEGDHLRTQENVVVHLGITQIEETVSQAGILIGRGRGYDLERQIILALTENCDGLGDDLDHTGGNLLIDGVLITLDDLTGNGHGALTIDVLEHVVIMHNDLGHAVLVTDIEEHNAAVVADILDPTRNAYLLTDMFFSQISAGHGAINISLHFLIFLSINVNTGSVQCRSRGHLRRITRQFFPIL